MTSQSPIRPIRPIRLRRRSLSIATCASLAAAMFAAVGINAASAGADPLPAPAAHWKFDEGAGSTAADSSGNGNAATLGSGASWVSGDVGPSAVAFDGSASGAATSPTPVIDTSKSFTVSAWVKFTGTTGFQTIVGVDGTQVSGFFLQLSGATGEFAMTRRASDNTGATEVRADSGVRPTAGTWYHVVGEDDATTNTVKVYVDGTKGNDATLTTPWAAAGPTTVGRGFYNGPTDYVNGNLDDVQIYQSALSDAQVAQLNQSAHWTYDEGTGTTAADASGNGNEQTLAAGAGWAPGEVGPYSLSLDGSPSGYASAAGPVIDTRYNFSVSAWVKLNNTDGFQDIAAVDGTNVSGFFLQLRGDTHKFAFTRLGADSTASSATFASGTDTAQAGQWYQLVGVNDAANGKLLLYVNGVLQDSVNYTGGWQATGSFTAGRGLYGGNPVDFLAGAVDDEQVLDYAATADDVTRLVGGTGGVLNVDGANPAHALPSTFFGLMTEDISHSMTGGLYAELINNRSMMASSAAPVDWNAEGNADLTLDPGNPLNTALTRSLKVAIGDASAAHPAGVSNSGYWGIPVVAKRSYQARFFVKASAGFTGPLTLSIVSADGSKTYASTTVSGVTTDWKQLKATLKTSTKVPATSDARYVITTTGNTGQTLWLDNVSLFPPTYKGTGPNGLRPDLMTELGDLAPAFIREPGGNYLEGNTIATRFNWKNTIGPIWTRPGHQDDAWGYYSTDGMGLLEYLEWCEALHAKPMLAVFAGYTLNGQSVPQDQLAPYVQDALDEIQYATGSTSTKWGKQRAKDGHPAPFDIQYTEVGNEDFFDGSGSYNEYRFPMFYDAIKAAYPAMKVIATTPVTSRTPDVVDDHYYQSPSWFNTHANQYDGYSRTAPKIMVGEWASQEGTPTPDLNAAIGDASWLTGLERNSDVVTQEAYAPMLVNVNASNWPTNLIGFNALTSYVSPSYWAQQMMAHNHGDQVLNASYSGIGGINVVATKDSATGTIYLTIVNPGAQPRPVQLNLTGVTGLSTSGIETVLSSANGTDTNTIDHPNNIAPVTHTISGVSPTYTQQVPGTSVTVLALNG